MTELNTKQPSFYPSAKTLNLGTFFFLYIAQAIPMSFFSTSIQVVMRQENYSLAAIALLQIIKLPWILKFLWSPMVDRYCNTYTGYKRCIIAFELIYALLILSVGFFRISDHFYLIIGLIVLALTASATQDIATDALAVLSFNRKDKSLINSMQSMGSFGGTLIGGGVLLLALDHHGWQRVTPGLGIFVLIALIPLLLNKTIRIEKKEERHRAKLTDFIWFFTRRNIWKQIGFLVLYYSSIIGTLSVLRPYLVDLGYSMKEIGIMSGVVGTAAAFMASFLAGFIVRRIGRESSRLLFALFIVLTTFYFVALSYTQPTTLLIYIGIILLWSSYGMATIVVYTTAMDCVRPGKEGTDFTIQTVITHLSGLLIAVISGCIADHLGYEGLFFFEAVLACISFLYILTVFRKKADI
ncbi:MAG: MFS transporter [Bacteroidia bacterium]|nr:MFS transporter [Bacteroidia bacterium]